ncbi:MAG TPA: hypothetical protein VFT34_11785 [Verrucomicrobiae bacterium]|nr:hypothetical protein [Verrucomicrobiae bacterium]
MNDNIGLFGTLFTGVVGILILVGSVIFFVVWLLFPFIVNHHLSKLREDSWRIHQQLLILNRWQEHFASTAERLHEQAVAIARWQQHLAIPPPPELPHEESALAEETSP